MNILAQLRNVILAIMLMLIAANDLRWISVDKEQIWLEYKDTSETQSSNTHEFNDFDADFDDYIKKSLSPISLLSNLIVHAGYVMFRQYTFLSDNNTPPPEAYPERS